MQWKGQSISDEQAQRFREEILHNKIKIVVAHDGYLINLASPEPTKLAISRWAFAEEIARCEQLGIPFLVFHPGAHLEAGTDRGLKTVTESIDFVLESHPQSGVKLLLETTAGQGSSLGSTFAELRTIIEGSAYPDRLGICLDTCHVFASGYDLVKKSNYEDTFKKFDDELGLTRLCCLHLNDSRRECGSRVDRHANLGEGYLGWKTFRRMLKDERFNALPLILETPGGDENFRQTIMALKQIRSR